MGRPSKLTNRSEWLEWAAREMREGRLQDHRGRSRQPKPKRIGGSKPKRITARPQFRFRDEPEERSLIGSSLMAWQELGW
jgi:hypothetical protein